MARNKTSGKGAEKKVVVKKAPAQKPVPARPATSAKAASAKPAPKPAPAAKAAPVKAEPAKKPAAAPVAKRPEKAAEKQAAPAAVKAPVAHAAPPAAAKPAAPKVAPAKAPSAPAAAKPAAPAKQPKVAPAIAAKAASAPATARAMPATAKPQAQTISAPAGHAKPAAPVAQAKPAAPAKPAPAAQAAAPAAGTAAKKNVSGRHGFKTSEWIVYPAHGVGRIVGIEEQEIAGISLELFVITFEKDKMTLRVPTGKSQSVGMRKLSEDATVKKAMETLKGKARVKRTMWSRRAQEYEAKINSGDLIAIAEVVRDLYRSESQPEQSYSERQLYEAALDRMAREIAAVEKLDERGAVQRITDVLAKSAKGRRAGGEEPAAGDAEIKAA
ncbi:MAG: CarD family transcriptional regulator [Hyphomicrobiaceae bacterium]|nr:CarD family transcriptional regulator [Hyphomicrobiaceae bacterium]